MKHIQFCIIALILGSQILSAQPNRWSVELVAAKGFVNSPQYALNVQGNYYFVATDLFRVGAGTGISMSKPLSSILASGEKLFGYTEWSVPVYLRGEYLKPTHTNGNLVLRTDAGYRIGAYTAYYQRLKDKTGDAGVRYWCGLFLEPQIGLLFSDRLFFSIGCCLQRGQYQETTVTRIIVPEIDTFKSVTEDKHAFLPVITLHIEYSF